MEESVRQWQPRPIMEKAILVPKKDVMQRTKANLASKRCRITLSFI